MAGPTTPELEERTGCVSGGFQIRLEYWSKMAAPTNRQTGAPKEERYRRREFANLDLQVGPCVLNEESLKLRSASVL